MPRYTKQNFQVGEWWLSQRSGSPAWYATLYVQAAKRTRRVSLGTDDFEQARQKLLDRYLAEHRPLNAPAEAVALADIVLDSYKAHGAQTRGAGSIRIKPRISSRPIGWGTAGNDGSAGGGESAAVL
jgi:hypothetical protein